MIWSKDVKTFRNHGYDVSTSFKFMSSVHNLACRRSVTSTVISNRCLHRTLVSCRDTNNGPCCLKQVEMQPRKHTCTPMLGGSPSRRLATRQNAPGACQSSKTGGESVECYRSLSEPQDACDESKAGQPHQRQVEMQCIGLGSEVG